MNTSLFKLIDSLNNELVSKGIVYYKNYPMIPAEMLIKERPKEILPFEHRNACTDKKNTLLCHYSTDNLLYRRLKYLEKDNEILQEYMGVIGFDLSPRLGWHTKHQKFNLLLNQTVNAYRALNGVKILPNFRTGDMDTMEILQAYPTNSWYAVGTLGCSRGYIKENSILLRTKLLYARPERLLIYGILRSEYKAILDEFGIPYDVYKDFRTRSYNKSKDKEDVQYGC
ncbi:MAG: DUF4417 domain-containing protein [Fibrobacter sp.]|nr:DUF4417 domain-containing protein [Fibrobacter sp.]